MCTRDGLAAWRGPAWLKACASVHTAQEVESLEAELAAGVQAAEAGRKRKRAAEGAGAKHEEGEEGEDKDGLAEDSKEGLGERGGRHGLRGARAGLEQHGTCVGALGCGCARAEPGWMQGMNLLLRQGCSHRLCSRPCRTSFEAALLLAALPACAEAKFDEEKDEGEAKGAAQSEQPPAKRVAALERAVDAG